MPYLDVRTFSTAAFFIFQAENFFRQCCKKESSFVGKEGIFRRVVLSDFFEFFFPLHYIFSVIFGCFSRNGLLDDVPSRTKFFQASLNLIICSSLATSKAFFFNTRHKARIFFCLTLQKQSYHVP